MSRHLSLLVVIAVLAFVASPFLFGQFGGYPPELFPMPQDDPPVQPAGWAFSIWGVIYAWLVASAAFGLVARRSTPDWTAMRLPLLASLVMGFFWIPLAGHAPVWATLLILLMTACAILAMIRAGRGDEWWQVLPLGLYAGWLTAASGVSIGIVLGGYAIMSPVWAAILCLILVCAVTLAVQVQRPMVWTYALAVIWALFGVIVGNLSPVSPATVIVAGLGMMAIGLIAWRARRTVTGPDRP
ncbi:TspO/MBR family protein [Paracoccus seriniphilus]|uniref:TspO/MBR family protein n=1 Tax=Paracoccus seriniphilus TaxID=184748 RepID=UPI003567D855